MPHTVFETKQHRIAFDALANSNIESGSTQLLGLHLSVPRNTRAHLISVQGSISDNESAVSSTSTTAALAIAKGGSTPPANWTDLQVIWVGHLRRAGTGTPDNYVNQLAPLVLDYDLIGRAYTLELSKGAKSNGITGWGLYGRSSSQYTVQIDITIHYVLEWIGGGGSKKNLNFQFDEEENQ